MTESVSPAAASYPAVPPKLTVRLEDETAETDAAIAADFDALNADLAALADRPPWAPRTEEYTPD